MSILETLLKAQGGNLVGQMAKQFGLGEDQATSAISSMLPALTRGMKQNVSQPNGLEALMDAIQKGNHGRYLDDASQFSQEATTNEGNGILGHLLGSKEVSRQVASQASQQTGIDAGILKKILPLLAAGTMGAVSKQSQGGGMLSALLGTSAKPEPQSQGLLGKFLDADGDGSVFDDALGLAKKFL